MIKCNGTRPIDKAIIQPFEYPSFELAINLARSLFVIAHPSEEWGINGKYFSGPRFLLNHHVIARILCNCPDRQYFEDNMQDWITAALDDCARSDHWYQFEKHF